MSEPDPISILDDLGIHGATSTTPISGGWDTTIWKIEHGTNTYALRLFQPGREKMVRREAETMRSAKAAGIAVPEIHVQGIWQGRAAMVLSWCAGRTLMDEMRARPWAIRRLGFLFGRHQALLHHTPFSPGDVDEFAWITRFSAVDDALRERLLSLNLQQNRLLHLDYHPLNVMVSDRKISGLLDWTNAMPGDPRADVARTWSILRLMPLNPGRPEPVTEAARRLLAAGWMRGYERTAGPLPDMALFKIWAGLAMLNDLAPKVGQPGIWLEQRHLDEIERRINRFRSQSGCLE
ncbi:hypothetical protein BH20CHL1_BH20CHL1_08470 [soil metagenome]